MSYRPLALAVAVAALSSMHVARSAAQHAYVAPGGISIGDGAGPVYVMPVPPINGAPAHVGAAYGYGRVADLDEPDYDYGYGPGPALPYEYGPGPHYGYRPVPRGYRYGPPPRYDYGYGPGPALPYEYGPGPRYGYGLGPRYGYGPVPRGYGYGPPPRYDYRYGPGPRYGYGYGPGPNYDYGSRPESLRPAPRYRRPARTVPHPPNDDAAELPGRLPAPFAGER